MLSHPNAHLDEWQVEQAAEDRLPGEAREAARLHLERCERCAAAVAVAREIVAALSSLPRFAPSPAFADAVMARVSPVAASAAARRWLPSTARGWGAMAAALLAPLAPFAVLVAWFVAGPVLSTSSSWAWGVEGVRGGLMSLAFGLAEAAVRGGALRWVEWISARTAGLDPSGLVWLGAAAAAGVPLSLWLLARLSRSPVEPVAHAR
jgi:anti-sigma factor RsiW